MAELHEGGAAHGPDSPAPPPTPQPDGESNESSAAPPPADAPAEGYEDEDEGEGEEAEGEGVPQLWAGVWAGAAAAVRPSAEALWAALASDDALMAKEAAFYLRHVLTSLHPESRAMVDDLLAAGLVPALRANLAVAEGSQALQACTLIDLLSVAHDGAHLGHVLVCVPDLVALLRNTSDAGPQNARGAACTALGHINKATSQAAATSSSPDPVFAAGAVRAVIDVLHVGPPSAVQHACEALSEFSFSDDAQVKRIFDAGAVEPLLRVIRLGPEDACSSASRALRNLAFPDDLVRPIFEAGACRVLVEALESGPSDAMEHVADALRNIVCDSETGKGALPLLPRIIHAFQRRSPGGAHPDDRLWTMFLRVVFNMSAFLDAAGRERMRELGVHELVMGSRNADSLDSSVVASLCVANLIGHEGANPLLESSRGLVSELLAVLEKALANERYAGGFWYVWTPLQGLANLSVNDCNKRLILAAGAVPSVVEVLRDTDDPRTLEYAAKTLANVAFVADLTEHAPDVEAVLTAAARRAARHPNRAAIQEFVQLAVFQLRERAGPPPLLPRPPADLGFELDTRRCVAVCRAPSSRKRFLPVERILEDAGYSVWASRHDGSDAMDSMALGIGPAIAVLLDLAPECKQDASCRVEAEYARSLGKPFIALRSELAYHPDGWLGRLDVAADISINAVRLGAKLLLSLEQLAVPPPPPDASVGSDRDPDLAARQASSESPRLMATVAPASAEPSDAQLKGNAVWHEVALLRARVGELEAGLGQRDEQISRLQDVCGRLEAVMARAEVEAERPLRPLDGTCSLM